MAISEAPRVVRHQRAMLPVMTPNALGDKVDVPQLHLLATASEEQVDRQAVQALRRHVQHHRNTVGATCLGGIGLVFGLALLMVQLAQ